MHCPCGSGRSFENCCGPYIEGQQNPPTAESLMRARFSAYALHRAPFIHATWLNPEDNIETLERDLKQIQFTKLEIVQTEAGGETDQTGRVAFIAHWKKGHRQGELREDSLFEKRDNRWIYIDGKPLTTNQLALRTPLSNQSETFSSPIKALQKPGRNDLCPCGSGLKFKRCCGR